VKTLLVMRHAKSSWDDPELEDHDRPLNGRGRRDAHRMALWLLQQGRRPDSITSSTAVRAATTAQLVAQQLGFQAPLDVTPELYHADLSAWARVIRKLPPESETALCIGHNPGIELLLRTLTGASEHVPTAAISLFEVPIEEWQAFDLQKPLESWTLWRPKALPEGPDLSPGS
jgi:phosphohistidine phosphatase